MLSFQSTQTDSSHLKPPPDHPRHLCLGSRCKPVCSDCAPALGGPRWGFDVTCFMPFHAVRHVETKLWIQNGLETFINTMNMKHNYTPIISRPSGSLKCQICVILVSTGASLWPVSHAVARLHWAVRLLPRCQQIDFTGKTLRGYLYRQYRFSENFEQKIAEATDSDQRDVTVAGTRSNSHRFLQYALYYMTTIYCFSLLFKENVSSNYNHSMSLKLLTLLL